MDGGIHGVEVDPIRDWLTPAYREWRRTMYGRRGVFIGWGWLFWVAIIFIALKAVIFWGVALLMLAAWLLTALWDMGTYRRRRTQALRRLLASHENI